VTSYTSSFTSIMNDLNADFKFSVNSFQGNVTYNDTHKALIDSATHIIIGSELGANTPAITGSGVIDQGASTTTYRFNFPRAVLDEAIAQKKPVVLLSQRVPYDIGYYPDAPTSVCIYGVKAITNGVYGMPNLKSGISAILGITKPKGKLPVQIPDTVGNILYERGTGLTL
ncbi:Beta-hexosaminidase, partial [Smittium culicis]